MILGLIFFIVVEILFLLIFKHLWDKVSLKKIILWNIIPLFVLVILFLYLSFDKDFLLSSVTYVFYLTTLYFVFWFPKFLFTLFYVFLSVPLIFLKISKLLKFRKFFTISISLVFFLVLLYGIFWGSRIISVTKKSVVVSKLPEKFDGIKILQISDLHLGSIWNKSSFLVKLINKINDLNPDIVVLTGDIVNQYYQELNGTDSILNKIIAPLGKFAVLGNHDFGDYLIWKCPKEKERNIANIVNALNKSGFKVLRNEHFYVIRENDSIAIIGVDNWGKRALKRYGDIEKASNKVKHFSIVLSHDPTYWEEKIVKTIPNSITFSGHTHAFQFGFCFKDCCWSPVSWVYRQWWGLYSINESFLYVNRGIGMVGFLGRVGMSPEITLVELKRGYE
jgi:hypothetical protein